MCHMIVIVLVCLALAESRWFRVQGGRCSDARHTTVSYIGIKTFFYQGTNSGFLHPNAYYYGSSLQDGEHVLFVLCLRHGILLTHLTFKNPPLRYVDVSVYLSCFCSVKVEHCCRAV